jgi:hypothetical protein
MDHELQSCWESATPPFDGEVLATSDFIELNELRQNLLSILSFLKLNFATQSIRAFDDWHEHDGYITASSETSWEMLEQILSSDRSLYDSRQGDAYVRKAFYSSSKSFLLRYYLMEENEDELYTGFQGHFDVTLAKSTMDDLISTLPESIRESTSRILAKDYFTERYAG